MEKKIETTIWWVRGLEGFGPCRRLPSSQQMKNRGYREHINGSVKLQLQQMHDGTGSRVFEDKGF